MMNVKRRYLKIKDFFLTPFFNLSQKWGLYKLNNKDRAKKIHNYIKEFHAWLINHKEYDNIRVYSLVLFTTCLIIGFVVWCYKHWEYSFLLGTGIAITLTITQYYLEWWYKIKKKYTVK